MSFEFACACFACGKRCDRLQLCVDHYPFMELDDNRGCEARDGYRQNLAALREASLAEGIPFWNFFVRKRQP